MHERSPLFLLDIHDSCEITPDSRCRLHITRYFILAVISHPRQGPASQ